MIGFTGPYSDVNFGDYAMLVNNVRTLGPAAATVFVYDRPFIESIRDRYLDGVDVTLVDVQVDVDQLGDVGARAALTPFELLRSVRNLDEVTEAVAGLDTLYVNGGGYLNSLWTRPHRIERLTQIVVPAIVAATQGKEIVITANGYGPFRGDIELFSSLFGTLAGARFGMRDAITSPSWLARAGVQESRTTLLPDDLLFVDDSLTPATRPRPDPYVVLETYMPVEHVAARVEEVRAFARTLLDRHGVRTLFVPFNVGHGGVDQGRLLADAIDEIELFDIEEAGYLAIEDAVGLVQHAELVLSNRYHAVVLALGAGTPTASVLKHVLGDTQYYFGKNAGAIQNLLAGAPYDLRDYLFSDLGEAMQMLTDDLDGIVQRQRRTYAAAVETAAPRLRAARAAFLEGGRS